MGQSHCELMSVAGLRDTYLLLILASDSHIFFENNEIILLYTTQSTRENVVPVGALRGLN